MARMSSGRATILSGLIVSDTFGTSLIFGTSVVPVSVAVPTGCQGAIIYGTLSTDTSYKLRFGTGDVAGTANAGWFREETEYVVPLNPSVNTISGAPLVAGSGTCFVTYIMGAGA